MRDRTERRIIGRFDDPNVPLAHDPYPAVNLRNRMGRGIQRQQIGHDRVVAHDGRHGIVLETRGTDHQFEQLAVGNDPDVILGARTGERAPSEDSDQKGGNGQYAFHRYSEYLLEYTPIR